jgi:GNAT superfamily N-acetyltransferase
MAARIRVTPVETGANLLDLIHFPWKIYAADPNWVPPLISERLDRLDADKNPFFSDAEVQLFIARRAGEVVGTAAAFVDHYGNAYRDEKVGGFGFFEVIEDFTVAQALLDRVCGVLRGWGVESLQGPTNFGINDEPGVLIEGADTPPAILEAHTPPYYQTFLERYGMRKCFDNYAWRVYLPELDSLLEDLPEQFFQVFEAAKDRKEVQIRALNMNEWESEMALTQYLYNEALSTRPRFVPMKKESFRRFAEQMRPLLDPDLVLFAEIEGKPVGYFVAIPDFNQVLKHLNGRLYPFGWLKLLWHRRRIDRISFKLLGILKEYRRRGIDVLLYMDAVGKAVEKGYRWLDGSLTSELNPIVWRLAARMGAERSKHYRLYEMDLA